jgi:hypothetical protein
MNNLTHNPNGRESKLVVELYDVVAAKDVKPGEGRYGNFLVQKYLWRDGWWCGAGVVKKFGKNESEARAYAVLWNGPDFVGGPGWEG